LARVFRSDSRRWQERRAMKASDLRTRAQTLTSFPSYFFLSGCGVHQSEQHVRSLTSKHCVPRQDAPAKSVKTAFRHAVSLAGLCGKVTPHTLRHSGDVADGTWRADLAGRRLSRDVSRNDRAHLRSPSPRPRAHRRTGDHVEIITDRHGMGSTLPAWS
jgi:hypothetical protein